MPLLFVFVVPDAMDRYKEILLYCCDIVNSREVEIHKNMYNVKYEYISFVNLFQLNWTQ